MKDELILAKIKRASNRKKVFLALSKPSLPSELVHELYRKSSSTYYVIVSRALRELVDLGVVKLINPKAKTGRLYTLTSLGRRLHKLL